MNDENLRIVFELLVNLHYDIPSSTGDLAGDIYGVNTVNNRRKILGHVSLLRSVGGWDIKNSRGELSISPDHFRLVNRFYREVLGSQLRDPEIAITVNAFSYAIGLADKTISSIGRARKKK